MSPKYRMTGCARLFLFLLILIPVSYIAAAYITGNDPISTIKELFNKEETEIIDRDNSNQLNVKDYQKLIDKKDEEILELKEEIYNLKKELKNTQNSN